MDREIQLELRMPNNKFKTFKQDFVPYSKQHEYIRLEKEMELKKSKINKEGEVIEKPSVEEYDRLQAEFVASLFDEKEVTAELIMNGLDALDRGKCWEIIRYRVLGVNKEEEDALKKAAMEAELAGLSTTTSSLDLSGKS